MYFSDVILMFYTFSSVIQKSAGFLHNVCFLWVF